ncbi:sulfur carrier protein ThiS [Marinimicrobium agarilyticum]|uniref:sulfur carrier protein ThiS n=1 Tax=Marinimicrobium agarilyticum TaxID=306546 RepID=UPI0004027EB0|nr:sulfur carrier protein ThiS [Marinimicrobium agarilyticum]
MINVSLNNEAAEIPDQTLLSEALAQWDYGEQKLAVAINGEFVPRSRYGEVALREGDRLDIVKPVGGG